MGKKEERKGGEMMETKNRLFWAVKYASLGLKVIPVHTIKEDGACTCKEGKDCKSKGKHPYIKDWQKEATTDVRKLREWFSYNNLANLNIGIVLEDTLVLDVDERSGGIETLEELKRDGILNLSAYPHSRTGGGGYHIFFKRPKGDIKNQTGALKGIDIKTNGGFIVAPPSRHASGREYEWVKIPHNLTCPLQEPPKALMDLLRNHHKKTPPLLELEEIPEGTRNETLFKIGCKLRAQGKDEEEIRAFLYEKNENCQPPLPTQEVERIIKSVIGYPKGVPKKSKKEETPKQADILLAIALEEVKEFFRDSENSETVFATFEVEGHLENSEIRKGAFRRWLRKHFLDREGKTPSSQAMQDAIESLEAIKYREPVKETFLRIGKDEEALFLDLGTPTWEGVKIIEKGWEIVPSDKMGCKFIRTKATRALPYPKKGGDLKEIKEILNIGNDPKTFYLVTAWLLGVFMVDKPFPILVLKGEQGSGKSTFSRLLKMILDPTRAPIRSTPKEERDLAIASKASFILSYDNISHIQTWLSDAFCRLATGAGFATRKLYKDDEEEIFEYIRPLILNGIGSFTSRSDLIDRCIFIELPPLEEGKRRPFEEVEALFKEKHPYLLGALLDLVSQGLRNKDKVIRTQTRMADFAIWVMKCLGDSQAVEFSEYYQENRERAFQEAIEDDPVFEALEILLQREPTFTGTTKALLGKLNQVASDEMKENKGWPKTSRSLGHKIARMAPAYRKAGVYIEDLGHKEKGRTYLIKKTIQ